MGRTASSDIRVLCVSGWSGAAAELTGRLVASRDRFERVFERDPHEALDLIDEGEADCVVASYTLAELDGLSLLSSVRAEHPSLPFVLVAADGSEAVAAKAVNDGVTAYVNVDGSGTDAEALADRIESAVHEWRGEDGDRLSGPGNPLAAVFGQFPEPTFAYEFDDEIGEAVIRAVNSEFESVFGYASEEAVGTPVDELIVPPERAAEADAVDERVRAGEEVDAELSRQTASGIREFRFRNIPLADTDPVDGFAVYADVTERKRREREAEERRIELERKNDQLEQLLSIISHDLRSPLNVAEGRVALARETEDVSHLDTVTESLERMESIIDDALSLAETGRAVTETEPVAVAPLVEACWEVVAEDGATVTCDVTGRIECDRGRLRHVFENLFRNAADHADGEVTVRVGEIIEDGEPVGFYVEDDGPGVPTDERDTVFEPRYTTSDSGTGLGLSIVAGIVDAHDWSVSVTESDSGGARFEVTDVTFV